MDEAIEARLPLSPVDFYILLVLTDSPLHGYAMMKAVERESNGRVVLQLGSLYRVISRLKDNQLIESRPSEVPGSGPGKPKRYYEISRFGRETLRAESARVVELAELLRGRKLHKGVPS